MACCKLVSLRLLRLSVERWWFVRFYCQLWRAGQLYMRANVVLKIWSSDILVPDQRKSAGLQNLNGSTILRIQLVVGLRRFRSNRMHCIVQ